MTDVMKEKVKPLFEVQKNQQQTKIVLEDWVFCILQTFVKQEKRNSSTFSSSKFPEK